MCIYLWEIDVLAFLNVYLKAYYIIYGRSRCIVDV